MPSLPVAHPFRPAESDVPGINRRDTTRPNHPSHWHALLPPTGSYYAASSRNKSCQITGSRTIYIQIYTVLIWRRWYVKGGITSPRSQSSSLGPGPNRRQQALQRERSPAHKLGDGRTHPRYCDEAEKRPWGCRPEAWRKIKK